MKSVSRPPNARRYLENLAATGRYHFDSADARTALGLSAVATTMAVNRLAKHGAIASPARGFYVIVPPEYRALGCLPAEQFVPALMKRLGLPYYAGLLTAAQYHGAARQRPQEFQVFLDRRRRSIACGRVRVGAEGKAGPLKTYVRARVHESTLLLPNAPRGNAVGDERWKLFVNAHVKPDL